MNGACSGLDGGEQKTAPWIPWPPFMAPRAVLPQTGSARVRVKSPLAVGAFINDPNEQGMTFIANRYHASGRKNDNVEEDHIRHNST